VIILTSERGRTGAVEESIVLSAETIAKARTGLRTLRKILEDAGEPITTRVPVKKVTPTDTDTRNQREKARDQIREKAAALRRSDSTLTEAESVAKAASLCPGAYERYRQGMLRGEGERNSPMLAYEDGLLLTSDRLVLKLAVQYAPAHGEFLRQASERATLSKTSLPQAIASMAGDPTCRSLWDRLEAERAAVSKVSDTSGVLGEIAARLSLMMAGERPRLLQRLLETEPAILGRLLEALTSETGSSS
jgi:hypothetical protein